MIEIIFTEGSGNRSSISLREIRKTMSFVFFLLAVFLHKYLLNITDSSQIYGNM